MHPMARMTALSLGLLATGVAAPARPAPTTVSTTLLWTAPGDDGTAGRAQEYSLRYSTTPIAEAGFNTATAVPGLPAPAVSGSAESFTITGLAPNTAYYFAIKTRDDAGNWSPLSNLATLTPATTGVGEQPVSSSFAAPWPNPARTGLHCAFVLRRAATLQADAFSVDGRRVRRLASGPRPAGEGEIAWDLRDEAGNRVPAGVYLVRARVDDTVWSRRVTVVR